MVLFVVCLFVGAALGLIGLRLLAYWGERPLPRPHFGWPHRRH